MRLQQEKIDVTVASSGTVSGSFQRPEWAFFTGVQIPDIDAGAVGLEMSIDDSTFVPILDPNDGEDAEIVANGADPCYVDFSELIASLPNEVYLRFTCVAQASGVVDFTVRYRG